MPCAYTEPITRDRCCDKCVVGARLCDIVRGCRAATRDGEGALTSLTSPPGRFLFIVARSNPKLATSLQQHFSGDATVRVIVDRRFGERRRQTAHVVPDRRRADRRSRPYVQKELRLTSFAIVTLPEPKPHREPFIS